MGKLNYYLNQLFKLNKTFQINYVLKKIDGSDPVRYKRIQIWMDFIKTTFGSGKYLI